VAPRRSWSDNLSDGKARFFLCALVALVYGDAVGYGYVNDDYGLVNITWALVLDSSLRTLLFRPLWYLSYWLTNALVQSAAVDHLVNLALFMVAAALGYQVAKRATHKASTALFATSAWVLLPWMTFPAVWISQRNDLLMFVFTFAALLASNGARANLSLPLMALAVLSKETVMLVPLYFAWKFRREGKIRLSSGFLLLWAASCAVILSRYANYHDQYEAPHLAALSLPVRLLNAMTHWAEPFLTQWIPFPFFVSLPHLALHLTGLAVLCISVRIRRRAFDREFLALALLVSVPSVVTPQLRIVGFESFCWLVLFARVLVPRQRLVFRAAAAALLVSSLVAIQATKRNLHSPHRDPHTPIVTPERYYPNDFYERKREFLLRMLGRREQDQ